MARKKPVTEQGGDTRKPRTQIPELAIVLPTFEERDNLEPLFERIVGALGDMAWEVIVVDDNSPDGTAEEARRLARSDCRIRVIERFGRRGLSSAAIEGFCATAAPYVAVMDADHQHDPAMLPAMLETVRSGTADIAVASRFVEGASMQGWANPDRERASAIANRLARMVSGVRLTDPMSGYFLLRTETARSLAPRLSGIGFKILLDLLGSAEPPLKIREVPIHFAARMSGESKLDHAIVFDFLVGVYGRLFGHIVPTRFALFGTVGAVGILVHISILLGVLHFAKSAFPWAQAIATFGAMSFNFWLNNWLTYRDRRLIGAKAWLGGWLSFVAACSVGAAANVAVASLAYLGGFSAILAALTGIAVGSVWNYAVSSRFVWNRF